jgi:hypothetical protein
MIGQEGEGVMTPVANAVEQLVLRERFEGLAAQWKAATAFLSSSTAMVAHPAYQAIIAMGPDVVPLLLSEMKRDSVHWFEALSAITGEDPVPREQWGHIPEMVSAWLMWGHERGFM